MDQEEIVVCVGKVTRVEEVPTRNGIAAHTESILDMSDDPKLLSTGSNYNSPTTLKQVSLIAELRYGRKYEVVLREVKPDLALTKKSRKFEE